MSGFLLDVSVLVALADKLHVSHAPCAKWFREHRGEGWATSPLAENGMVRMLALPGYPLRVDVLAGVQLLLAAKDAADYSFVPDDISLTDEAIFRPEFIIGHGQITDVYLLGLSMKHGLRFATLDRRISTAALVNPTANLVELI